MGLSYVGSSRSPSWAGWDWPGSQYAFGALYNTPNFDVKVTQVAAYFNTINGNGAFGSVFIFDDVNGFFWYNHQFGIINNSNTGAGAGQWWLDTVVSNSNVIIPANTGIWIGGYSNQGLIFSTYDSSPQAYVESNGTSTCTDFGTPTSSGQGPCGGYIQVSNLVRPAAFHLGGSGGLASTSNLMITASGIVDMGSNGGGMPAINSQVRSAFLTTFGGGGGLQDSAIVHVPTLRIWRP